MKLILSKTSDYFGSWMWNEHDEGGVSLECPVCNERTEYRHYYFDVSASPRLNDVIMCPRCLTKYKVIEMSLNWLDWCECKFQCELQPSHMAKNIRDLKFRMIEWQKMWQKSVLPNEDYVDKVDRNALIINNYIIAYTNLETMEEIKEDTELMTWITLWSVSIDNAIILHIESD